MPWPGVKTRMVLDTGDLRLEAGADEGSYILDDRSGNPYVDTGTLGRYRINCQFDAKESGGVIADDTNEIEVKLEIDTAIAAGPVWIGWQPYKPGEYYCRWYRIRATVKVDAAYGNRPRLLRFENSSIPIGSVPVASSIDDVIVTPTGSEVLGTRYLVATGGTGVFLNKDDQFAELLDTTDRVWEFSLPTEGQKVYNISDAWVYEYEGGDYPAGSWVPRGLNNLNPEKDKFVGAVTVVGTKDQLWNTDGGGDIGQSADKRPDNVHALSGMTIGGVAVVAGGAPSPHLLGGGHHSADSLANLNTKVTGGSLDFTTDPRDPNAHGPDHEDGGGDEIDVGGLSGQLADDQPALAHTLGGAKHTADSLANLNSKVTGGNLDFDSASRPPDTHKDSHTSGGDAFVATDLLEAIVKRLQVTGPVTLLIGAVADGAFLKRSGTGLIGADPVPSTSKVRAYLSAATQAIPDNTKTLVEFDAETFDSLGDFNTGTYRFVAPVTGYYLVNVSLFCSFTAGAQWTGYIHRSAAEIHRTHLTGFTAASMLNFHDLVYMTASQYIDVWVHQNSGVSKNILGTEKQTHLQIVRLL